MAVEKSLVLVLRCHDFSETSQVVTLLARSVGRVRCLAKGSKRPRNAFGGPLDRWTLGEAVFSLRDPSRLATLMELYELERFAGLRDRLPAYLGACGVTDLLMAIVPDADPQPEVFDLAVETLRRLAEAPPEAARAITLAFAWRLLARLGYGADLTRCVGCGRELAGGKGVDFRGAAGGAVCPRCRAAAPTVRLSAKAAEAIAFLAAAPWTEVRRVRLSDPTAAQIRAALRSRVEELAGKQLEALEYV